MCVYGQNHKMFAGETKVITVQCVNSSTVAAIDFTGASSVEWVVKNRAGTTILTKTLSDGISASAGTLTITLTSANTSGLSGTYPHRCDAVLADGTDTVLFVGELTVEE